MPHAIAPKYEMIMYESSRNTYRVCMQKSYKKLMKETEEDWNKWRDILCSWIGGLNIVDVSSSQFDPQIQDNFNQNISKLLCWYQRTNYKVYIKRQKKLDRQYNTEEELKNTEGSWRTHTIQLQDLL